MGGNMVVYQELASGVALFALNCNKSWWWWWFFLPIIIPPLVELLWPSLWQYSNIFEYSTTHYILEAHLKHTWSILGAYLEHTWSILEPYLKHTWSILEANLKQTWSILEAYLKLTWSILSRVTNRRMNRWRNKGKVALIELLSQIKSRLFNTSREKTWKQGPPSVWAEI
jgi:hypothetical protein